MKQIKAKSNNIITDDTKITERILSITSKHEYST